MPDVYRAPMRSRSDDVDLRATIERALRLGLCGFGQRVRDRGEAQRHARRVARFADIEDGSFVWTRDDEGYYWLGRIEGPYFYDDDAAAGAVDLVHVRPCRWLSEPVLEPDAPPAVVTTLPAAAATFNRRTTPPSARRPLCYGKSGPTDDHAANDRISGTDGR